MGRSQSVSGVRGWRTLASASKILACSVGHRCRPCTHSAPTPMPGLHALPTPSLKPPLAADPRHRVHWLQPLHLSKFALRKGSCARG